MSSSCPTFHSRSTSRCKPAGSHADVGDGARLAHPPIHNRRNRRLRAACEPRRSLFHLAGRTRSRSRRAKPRWFHSASLCISRPVMYWRCAFRGRSSLRSTGVEDCLLRRIPRDAALRLLQDYVDVAWRKQTIAGREVSPLFVSHDDWMTLAIGTRTPRTRRAAANLRAARLDADKAGHCQELSRRPRCWQRSPYVLPAYSCSSNGCSKTEGTTFTEYLLTQRLARAHHMLSDPRRTAEKHPDACGLR